MVCHRPWIGSDSHFVWLFGFDEWWHTRSEGEKMAHLMVTEVREKK